MLVLIFTLPINTVIHLNILSSCHNAVPSGPPQSPSVSVLSSQRIEINWLPPLLPDQNGVITGYIIVVTPLITGISQQLITSVTNTLLVPNLAPFTTYVCIVAARTAQGRGPFSTVLTVQTLEAGKQQQQQQKTTHDNTTRAVSSKHWLGGGAWDVGVVGHSFYRFTCFLCSPPLPKYGPDNNKTITRTQQQNINNNNNNIRPLHMHIVLVMLHSHVLRFIL